LLNWRRILIVFLRLSKIRKFLFKIQLHKIVFIMIQLKVKANMILIVMIVATALLKVVVDLLGLILEIVKL